jgi:hypothetical protein
MSIRIKVYNENTRDYLRDDDGCIHLFADYNEVARTFIFEHCNPNDSEELDFFSNLGVERIISEIMPSYGYSYEGVR